MRNSLDQDGLQTCLRESGLDCSVIKASPLREAALYGLGLELAERG